MNDAVNLKLENQNTIIDQLHYFIADNFPDGTVLFFQIFVKALLLLSIFIILDLFQRKILIRLIRKWVPKTKNIWINTFIKKDVFTSFFHLLPLGICYCLVPLIFYHHPQSFHILDLIFSILLLIFLSKFFIHVIDVYTEIKSKDQSYRTVALKTFSELFKLLIILFTCFIVVSILFNLSSAKIFAFLGAIMAVILLIFKDPILGFVAGLNIANSKQIKVGDWISVPKYGLDGNVKDINLVTTKIQNSDKTVSTIPTYDLIATEVKNYEIMRSSNTRRIKRSLTFNFKSFKLLDESILNNLTKIELLSSYLQKKEKEIKDQNSTDFVYPILDEDNDYITNIGVFRYYTQLYLENNPRISKKDTIMVRQLEPTIYGQPVEVYCFSSTSDWKMYEDTQALLFEHLIAVTHLFQLELTLVSPS
ncbi:mechanosensitive ion channel [Apibacter raozihei]|uniref:mechanosensitive ion channel family protein n=1 Tax=Apibacter raozihei TaxID=2500547 RepID=UPI000FE43910|nr:mechanosensitive ion channel domain-containing protein [Apibacter raozihei]